MLGVAMVMLPLYNALKEKGRASEFWKRGFACAGNCSDLKNGSLAAFGEEAGMELADAFLSAVHPTKIMLLSNLDQTDAEKTQFVLSHENLQGWLHTNLVFFKKLKIEKFIVSLN